MFSLFNSKKSSRKKTVIEIAQEFTSNYKISCSNNSSKFEIQIPINYFKTKDSFVKKAELYLKNNNYIIRPHNAGLQGDKGDIYINFTYPPEDANHKAFCYIDIIWKNE